MKSKKMTVFLALIMVLVQILSVCVFASGDEYDMYDDEYSEEYYEEVEEDYDDDFMIPEEAFWFFYAINAFIIPTVGLIVGYCLSRSEKRGRPKYWLIFSGICLLWIVLAAILMLILLL